VSDEFEDIARLFRPLAAGAPEAFGLADDAAAIPSRPGFDLVVTKDAIVEGVHFLPTDPPDLVARKLLRVNLSDLSAKAAAPYGYFLSVHWPVDYPAADREAFARGLAEDQALYGLHLLGGDTVSTPGPLTFTATMMGWVPAGAMVRRSTARSGDVVLVTGSIGDSALGLQVLQASLSGDPILDYLIGRYRLPEPRTVLREALAANATAAADVSDGLVADAMRIAEASGVAIQIDLERLPLSEAATGWLGGQADKAQALADLASGGDDYEVLCTADMGGAMRLAFAAAEAGVAITPIGRVAAGEGTAVLHMGRALSMQRTGWRHG
jgi:thiamine-monophosphate kinase